ncbi:hypothetical protein HPB49_009591 [Dermacentor silvarum]|uniref:Uncharacterized protein n=1 Tax=Dermacentor silvarum TaxID=543639 RepID=A0ACB8D4D7_DERSI|nr:hypothetical protein HPB49_009591 [Dermacentor silvarum]
MVNRGDLPFPTVHHVFLEILLHRREDTSLFIHNVYIPAHVTKDLSVLALLRAAAARAALFPFLALGDFNVRHTDWGYPKVDGPGTRLSQLTHDLHSSLLTDPTQTARIGNTACPDTTSDLSFCRYVHDARCSNTHQSVGSNHYVLVIQVRTRPALRIGHVHSTQSAALNVEDLSRWTNQLLAKLDGVSTSTSTTEDHPAVDSRLAHLWAVAPVSPTVGISNVTTIACAAASHNCELGCKQYCYFLRHYLDPPSAKSVALEQLRVVRAYPSDPPTSSLPLPSYSGAPNPEMDADITETEVYAALHKLRTTSAPARPRPPRPIHLLAR